MIKPRKGAKTIDIWKKKQWHRVIAPKLFQEAVIGETPSLEPNNLIGRNLTVNMMTITGNPKKQHVNLTFEIDRVMGETAYTHVKKYEIVPASIRRLVRRRKTRIDDSFVCKSKDGKLIRFKPFLLTRNLASKSVATDLKKVVRQFIARVANNMDFEAILNDVLTAKLQLSLKDDLKKIFPLKSCDIRVMVLEKEKKKGSVDKTAEVTEVKEEKKVEEKTEVKETLAKKEEVKVEKTEVKIEKPEEKKAETKTEEPVKESKEKVEENKPEVKAEEPAKEEKSDK